MYSDTKAIFKAYPNVVQIDEGEGAFDINDNKVEIDQSLVDAARAAIDSEYALVKYKDDRKSAYPSIEDQLDMQYWDSVNGTTTWKDAIAKVKSDNPKPS